MTLRKKILVVLLLLGAALWFRDNLLLFGANRYLAAADITLTHAQGLDFSSTHVALEELVLVLPSGLQLALSELDVKFHMTELSWAPVLDSIAIGSADLQDGEQSSSSPISTSLQLSAVLKLLREFPVASIVVDDLAVPQARETLAVNLQHSPGKLDLQIDSGALHFLAGFTQVDANAMAQLQMQLSRLDETVGELELSLQPEASEFALTGSGHLEFMDLDALLSELALELPVRPVNAATLAWDFSGTLADDFRGALYDATSSSFDIGVRGGSTLALPANLATGLGALALEFTDQAALSVVTGAGFGISTGSLPLQAMGSWQEQDFAVDTVLTLSDCRMTASATCSIGFNGNASYASYTLAGAVQVVAPNLGSGRGLDGQYQVHTEGLVLGGLPAWLPTFDLDANLALVQDTLTFATPLLLQNVPADTDLGAAGSYDFATGASSLHLILQRLEFMEQSRPLSAWVNGWSYPFDVLSGSMAGELALNWQAGVMTGNIEASLNAVGGFYRDIYFRGLSVPLQASFATTEPFTMTTPMLLLTIDGLDFGVPVSNIGINFGIDGAAQQLRVVSFQGEALGGTVTATDITYDFSRERNDILLRFSGLRLEDMLALVDYDGVAAVGAVSGELPLTITANGVEVAAGSLQADEPGGSIKYLGAATAQGNVGLDLMNQALGNYQFESLASSINYAPDGELLLAMQLQGHNPDMNNGQRINLNLNLSDNIPALLESLQAARAIEDFLQAQYE